MKLTTLFTCLLPLFSSLVSADLILFPYSSGDGSAGNAVGDVAGFGNRVPISTSCQQALNVTITCDPVVQQLAVNGYSDSLNFTTGSSYAQVCTTACKNSLSSYAGSVTAACGTSTAAFGGLPNSYRGDVLWQWFNNTCQQDPSTGLYCADFILHQMAEYTGPTDIDYTDLPTSIICTPCHISRWKALQSSPFSGYDEEKQEQWIKIQQRCGLSLPTTIPPDFSFNIPNSANSTGSDTTTPCISAKSYTVKSGDTCHSIAASQSVAEGTLRLINQILPDCSNIAVGQNLCLPPSCSTYLFKNDDTCAAIAGALGITTGTLLGYNPSINPDCSNTGINGTYICITSPYAEYTPVLINGTATNSGIYAESAVPAPGIVARGTTRNCGKYYKVVEGDICQVISLTQKVSLDLFSQINPSINEACDNLVIDLFYCVQPTRNWQGDPSDDTTSTRATVSPPAPTESGTVACYEWHVVAKGEFCGLILSSYGITMAQLIRWNPTLKEDCSNLLLDEAYCVDGVEPDTTTTSSTTSRVTTTTSRVTTTPIRTTTTTTRITTTTSRVTTTSAVAGCQQHYTVVSGDFCFKIWTDFGLTEAQFRTLNPQLNAACDLDIGDVLCVK